MSKKKTVYLSASRIKTLESCSWLYWGKYHLHLPDTGNDGAARGTVCHWIFELLLSEKNFKYFELIMHIPQAPEIDGAEPEGTVDTSDSDMVIKAE